MGKHRGRKAQIKESVNWPQILKIFALPGLFFAAVVAFLGNVTAICDRDALRSTCTSLGFQVDSVEKLVIALNSSEPVSRTAAFVKLTELLTKQPEISRVAKPLFIAHFNQQYAIGSNKRAAEDLNIHAELNLIGILAQNLKSKDEIELKNVDLQNVDLSNLSFDGVKLTNVRLQDSNMQDFSLKGATITESRMDRVTASKLNLQDTKIANTCFESAVLKNVNLQNSSLIDVDFNNANLDQANLSVTTLNRVRFAGATFTEALFSGTKPTAISFLPNPQLVKQLSVQFPNTPRERFSFNPRQYSQCHT